MPIQLHCFYIFYSIIKVFYLERTLTYLIATDDDLTGQSNIQIIWMRCFNKIIRILSWLPDPSYNRNQVTIDLV